MKFRYAKINNVKGWKKVVICATCWPPSTPTRFCCSKAEVGVCGTLEVASCDLMLVQFVAQRHNGLDECHPLQGAREWELETTPKWPDRAIDRGHNPLLRIEMYQLREAGSCVWL
jgi:hypothetical protein